MAFRTWTRADSFIIDKQIKCVHDGEDMKHKLPSKLVFLCIGIFIVGILVGFASAKVFKASIFAQKITHSLPSAALYTNSEKEPNNTFTQANNLIPGYETMGTFSNAGDVDMYKFTLENPATVKINLSNVPSKYSMFVYNENHEAVAFADRNGFSGSTSMVSLPESGTYYIKMAENAEDKQINTPYTITLDILPFAD